MDIALALPWIIFAIALVVDFFLQCVFMVHMQAQDVERGAWVSILLFMTALFPQVANDDQRVRAEVARCAVG